MRAARIYRDREQWAQEQDEGGYVSCWDETICRLLEKTRGQRRKNELRVGGRAPTEDASLEDLIRESRREVEALQKKTRAVAEELAARERKPAREFRRWSVPRAERRKEERRKKKAETLALTPKPAWLHRDHESLLRRVLLEKGPLSKRRAWAEVGGTYKLFSAAWEKLRESEPQLFAEKIAAE